MNRIKNHKKCLLLLGCVFMLGCTNAVDDEPIIMIDATEDEIVYSMDEITMGDVILTKNVSCKYVQTSQQDVAFPIGGKIVDKVFVKVGDKVEVGDPLVELDSGNTVEEIANLEYQIASSELRLGYLDKAEEFDKQNAYYSFAYASGEKTEDDVKEYDEGISEIEENYTYQREDFEDSIEFNKRKLNKLKNEYEGNRVYANMTGKVIYIKSGLEGSTAKKDDIIITIVDNDNGLFEIEEPMAAKFFSAGEAVNMSIVYGDGKGEYELIPYGMENWGDKQTFEVLSGPETATLEVGVSGTIVATEDKKENVMRIPIKALYEADGKYYTYILNDENMREARFIDVGLVGDDFAQVLGGIDLGTKVVRR